MFHPIHTKQSPRETLVNISMLELDKQRGGTDKMARISTPTKDVPPLVVLQKTLKETLKCMQEVKDRLLQPSAKHLQDMLKAPVQNHKCEACSTLKLE